MPICFGIIKVRPFGLLAGAQIFVRSQNKNVSMSEPKEAKFGINSWLEDELYQNYLHDRKAVDESWKSVFETNGHVKVNGHSASAPAPNPPVTSNGPVSASVPAVTVGPNEELQPLRGVAAKIADNMMASLTVPTATSQRVISVRALENARNVINEQRSARGESKLSYTQFISWALIQALKEFPTLNDAFTVQNGDPCRIVRKQINFGLAVDVKGKDGNSSLLVPNIKDAGSMTFVQFLAAFDDVVSRARTGKLQMPDFQGTSISLTNPGTVGTAGSVPRLVVGQGAIIATGAMDYPAGFDSVPAGTKASLGLSKVMMMTCTYDHRIIQGADSGRFLGKVHALLNGEGGFYDSIYSALNVQPKAVAPPVKTQAAGLSESDAIREAAVASLIHAHRVRGHLLVMLDPLGTPRPPQPDLDFHTYGLTEADLDLPVLAQGGKKLRDILEELRKTYCDKIGVEYMHLHDPAQREWLRERMESTSNDWPLDRQTKIRILENLMEVEEFENFLEKRFKGKKRFSVEGGEASMAALDEILERAANDGMKEVVMGMAHRGRLAILANLVGKPIHQVFAEFDEAPNAAANTFGSGDVKYHLGAEGIHKASTGKEVTVSVAFNPSHLEAVDPVVEGVVRTKQDQLGDTARERVLPLLIHGDAAFAGQGVVPETMNLSKLQGYSTGGTVHLIINNQLGFTTLPNDARTGTYSSDWAKAAQCPIFHVNGDYPEAVFRTAQLAYDFRQRFKQDSLVDMYCFRKYGHNEGDDPTYTQPVIYKNIRAHKSVIAQYTEKLIAEGVLTPEEYETHRKSYVMKLNEAFDLARRNADTYELQEIPPAPLQLVNDRTAINQAMVEKIIHGLTTVPPDFHLHPKLGKAFNEKRKEFLNGAPMDWGLGEALAFGSLVLEGYPVRLSGQDSGRGTFSHRHSEFIDYETAAKYVPLQHLDPNQAPFEVWNSSLSEFAVMGFEFGYSITNPQALVMWEAQFGDFVNGAQIIVDQFLSSAEYKWGTPCGLVLLLPHGYEGQGPEHSSARIERFLQLCAENNMIVANCSTPAQFFHILRRQMKGSQDGKPLRKPLIIFTPKGTLRHPRAVSHLEDITRKGFYEVFPDVGGAPEKDITRVLLCSGKVYYDLEKGREERDAKHVAILRLEQLYPFPKNDLESLLAQYSPKAEVFWVQEEPRNMGGWRFVRENLMDMLESTRRTPFYAGRPESASPAVGTSKRHEQEQRLIVDDAFSAQPAVRKPRRVKLVQKTR